MRSHLRHTSGNIGIIATIGVAVSILLTGCGAAPIGDPVDDGNAPPETTQAPLLGAVTFGTDCSTTQQNFLNETMFYGRVAAASRAFANCLGEAMAVGTPGVNGVGPYIGCTGDPLTGASITAQTIKAIEVARGWNKVHQLCTGGGPGTARVFAAHDVDYTGREDLSWNGDPAGWLNAVGVAKFNMPVCNGSNGPNCRNEPDPFHQAAGTVWHEAMHNHGYRHGHDTDHNAARTACGIDTGANPDWNFTTDTVPYMVEACINAALASSAAQCSNFKGCGPRALGMLTNIAGSTCECVQDPRFAGLGIKSLKSNFTVSYPDLSQGQHVADGDRMGGWLYNNDNVNGVLDFDGNGRKDFIVTSGWGFGVMTQRTSDDTLQHLDMTHWGTTIGTWTTASDQMDIKRIGNVDGDSSGSEELLFRSPANGIAVVKRGSGGGFSLVKKYAWGNFLGWWNLGANDTLVPNNAVGDFDNNGRQDFIVKSNWGIGFISLGTNGELFQLSAVAAGTNLGGYVVSSNDTIVGVGDFNRDQRADLLIRNSTGLAILALDTSNNVFALSVVLNGWGMGFWGYNASDLIPAVGDFNDDDFTDFVIQSSWGIGVISRSSGSLSQTTAVADGGAIGTWTLHTAADRICGAGDFTGDGYADLLIRSGNGDVGILGHKDGLSAFFVAIDKHPFRTLMGGWEPGNTCSRLKGMGDFDGDGRADILVRHLPRDLF